MFQIPFVFSLMTWKQWFRTSQKGIHNEVVKVYSGYSPVPQWYSTKRTYKFPFIDVFFYNKNKTHLWFMEDTYDRPKGQTWMGYNYMRLEDVFPLHLRPLGKFWWMLKYTNLNLKIHVQFLQVDIGFRLKETRRSIWTRNIPEPLFEISASVRGGVIAMKNHRNLLLFSGVPIWKLIIRLPTGNALMRLALRVSWKMGE